MRWGRFLPFFVALLALLFALPAIAHSGASTLVEQTLPTPTSTPTLAPGEVRPHVYRLEQFDSASATYFLTLNSDGTSALATRRTGTSSLVTIAAGTWHPLFDDGSEVQVNLTTSRVGINLALDNIFTLAYVRGFPTVMSIGDGKVVQQVGAAQFSLGAGDTHPLVEDLHQLLAAIPWLGFAYPADAPDQFNEATRVAVERFQRVQGLVPSGAVDIETWIALQDPNMIAPTPTLVPPTPTPVPTLESTATPLPAAPAAPPAQDGSIPTPPDLSLLPDHDADGNPIIYLSFDDGPQPGSTQPILDLLAQYNAKATFFNIGVNVHSYPDLVRAVVSAGHYVGDHTWTHTSLQGMTSEQFFSEVEQTRDVLVATAGDLMTMDGTVRLLRPPYGATDENTTTMAHEQGYALVMWTIDPQDWRRPGVEEIANHVIGHAYPGAIVLMHDGGGDRSQTVAALGTILPALQGASYQMHTIFVP